MASLILGAAIYICGAGLIALGENLVKLSNTVSTGAAWYTWFLGVFVFVLGNGTHFVSFGFAAQSF